MDPLQEIGGGDVGHVEGRVLAHQHHVELREVTHLGLAQGVMVALHGPQVQRLPTPQDPAILQRQPVGTVMPQRVASALGFHHHQEGGVGLDVDPLDGIHLDGDLERHAISRSNDVRPWGGLAFR